MIGSCCCHVCCVVIANMHPVEFILARALRREIARGRA